MNKAENAEAGTVIVFSPATSCGQCIATYRALDAKGITYRTITVADDDEDTRNKLKAAGFMGFPVVTVPGFGHWCGFRPDKIDEAAAAIAKEAGR